MLESSHTGAYIGSLAWVVIGLAVGYLIVLTYEARRRFRWLILMSAVLFFTFAYIEPPPPAQAMIARESYSLTAGLRTFMLSLVIAVSVLEFSRWKH